MTDYKKEVQLIKDGGYATSITYVDRVCSIIERWNLTQYDVKENAAESVNGIVYARAGQMLRARRELIRYYGMPRLVLIRMRAILFLTGMIIVVYAPSKSSEPGQKKTSYRVRVSIKNLNIRKGPGTNYDKIGKYTGIGVFTIVAESKGKGATKWGKLKSGAGWISLDFTEKI